MSKNTRMNGGLHKSISVFLTLSIITILVLMGPASAVQVILSNPNNANQGEDVEFDITVELEAPDQYLPVQYTEVTFTGPNDFEETCKIYNDGTVSDCSLNLDVDVDFGNYGEGYRFGYDYNDGNNYYFGYGYGYGYGYYGNAPEITYHIVWHTPGSLNSGNYDVLAKVYAISEDEYYDWSPFSYCGVMEGMYIEWLSLNPGGADYDSNLDLNQDGKNDLTDVVIFSQNKDNETWCEENGDCSLLYGRFKEFLRVQTEGNVINEDLDLNDDNVVDIDDIILFGQNLDDESWCAAKIALSYEGISHTFGSSTKGFTISTPVLSSGSSGGSGRGIWKDLFEEETQEEQNNEDSSNQNVQEEEFTQEQQTENRNIFNDITGAVAGLGEDLGLGKTISYLFSILIIFLVIFYGFRLFSKRR